jgi:alkanesulfonate monooxygenase SsuD/methylene tetrahydromethanopterin reductase-like flavin-dependent oxidoreductase (luciferase family)
MSQVDVGAGTPRVRFPDALAYGFVPPDDDRDAVPRLEDMNVDSLWAGGHIAARPPSHEAIVGLTRLAVESRRVMVGASVLVLPLYPPAIVAKQVAEIDRLADGRTVLGVGVGGEYASDFDAVHVPVSERGRRTDEAIPLIRRLWTAEPVDHAGPRFPMSGIRIHPGPLQAGGPPIIVAGRKPAAMLRAATLGDGWMPYLYSADRYRDSVTTIREAAAAQGRSLEHFGWFLWTTVNVRGDAQIARRQTADFLRDSTASGQDFEAILDHVAIAGDPDQVIARLLAYHQAGARHFIFATLPGDAFETVRWLVDEIMPAVSAAASS